MEPDTNTHPLPPPAQHTPIQTQVPEKHNPPILLWLLILTFIGIASYFGYQYWQLRQRVTPPSSQTTQLPTPTPETGIPSSARIVFIRDNNVWSAINGKESKITTDGTVAAFGTGFPSIYYSYPVFSPDKTSIAFIRSVGNNTTNRSLYITNTDTTTRARKLADDVDWAVDFVQWKQDGSEIYYVSPKDKEYDTRIIKSINPSTNAKQIIGEYTFGSGCGGGSDDIADHLTWGENIGGWPITFKLAPDASFIIHSTNCTGSGIGIFDLATKKDQLLNETERGVVFSADGKRFAALSKIGISLYDTVTRRLLKSIKTSETPSALLFSQDGQTIFFTTTKEGKTLTFDPQVGMDLVGSSPAEFRQLITTAWSLSLLNNTITTIATLDAHNARPLYTNSQKNVLGLAVVDNATDLFNYYSTNKTKTGAESHFPKVNIVEVHVQTGTKDVVIHNATQSNY